MTEPIRRAYKVYRGDAWTGDVFRLRTNQTPTFWASPVVRSQIRKTVSTPAVLELDIDVSTATENAEALLIFELSMSPGETEQLAPGRYVGDVEVSSSECPKTTLITYTLDVIADVTRD